MQSINGSLTHEIKVGQVYGLARTKEETADGVVYEEQFRLVYEDDERVLLRSNKEITHGRLEGYKNYRCEARSTFEEQAVSGFYQLIDGSDESPRMPTDGITSALAVLKSRRDDVRRRMENGGGRKEKHFVEAFNEAIEAVSELSPTEVDWTAVDGVGEATAENLEDAGYETDADIRAASDDDLLAIGGIGEKNLSNLKDKADTA